MELKKLGLNAFYEYGYNIPLLPLTRLLGAKAAGGNLTDNGVFYASDVLGNPRLNTTAGDPDAVEVLTRRADGSESVYTDPDTGGNSSFTMTVSAGGGVELYVTYLMLFSVAGPIEDGTNLTLPRVILRPRRYAATADSTDVAATTTTFSSRTFRTLSGTPFSAGSSCKGWMVEFTSGTYKGQVREISGYAVGGSGGTAYGQITWVDALAGAPAATDTFIVYNAKAFLPVGWSGPIRNNTIDDVRTSTDAGMESASTGIATANRRILEVLRTACCGTSATIGTVELLRGAFTGNTLSIYFAAQEAVDNWANYGEGGVFPTGDYYILCGTLAGDGTWTPVVPAPEPVASAYGANYFVVWETGVDGSPHGGERPTASSDCHIRITEESSRGEKFDLLLPSGKIDHGIIGIMGRLLNLERGSGNSVLEANRVLDAAASSHNTAGTIGHAINDAGAGGGGGGVIVQGLVGVSVDTLKRLGQTAEVYRGDANVILPYNLGRDITGWTVEFAAKATLGDSSYAIATKDISSSVISAALGTGGIPLTAANLNLDPGTYIGEIRLVKRAGSPLAITNECTVLQFNLVVLQDVNASA